MELFAQRMKAFVAVADADGFSAAALRLGLTQSTVSKQVAALERDLGTRLFQRTTRSLVLTKEGSAFYEASLRALAALDEAVSAVGSHGETQGFLRLTMPLTLAESRVIRMISEFLIRYPRVQVDLSISDHAVHLVADQIDVALRVGRLVDSGLIARKIGVAKRVAVASPAYLDRHGRPELVADLATHNCLSYSLLSTGPTWRFTNGGEVKIMGNFKTDSPNALRAAALSGIGIAVNATWLFENELADGTLERVLPDQEPEPMPIHAVLPSGRYVAARTRAFVDFMADAFARDPLLHD